MAQFDVHRNPGPRRAIVPLVVVVQSRRLDTYGRRLVVPLVLRSEVSALAPGLNPVFRVDGLEVVLHPLDMVSVPVSQLGERVGSLQGDADRVITAIDVVISRAWG